MAQGLKGTGTCLATLVAGGGGGGIVWFSILLR